MKPPELFRFVTRYSQIARNAWQQAAREKSNLFDNYHTTALTIGKAPRRGTASGAFDLTTGGFVPQAKLIGEPPVNI